MYDPIIQSYGGLTIRCIGDAKPWIKHGVIRIDRIVQAVSPWPLTPERYRAQPSSRCRVGDTGTEGTELIMQVPRRLSGIPSQPVINRPFWRNPPLVLDV